jgi:hypothetical protein
VRPRRTGGLAELGQKKKKAGHKKPASLLITDLPRLTLEQLADALAEGVRWHAVMPLTDEQAIAQSRALVALRQMQWHVNYALHGDSAPLVYLDRKP